MPRLDRLAEINRKTLLTFPSRVYDATPFVRPPKPLSRMTVAIVTTAGLHGRDDRPFVPGDQSFRAISSDAPPADIVQSHTSIGFDRLPIMRDLNVTYPIDRLRELVARGEVGAIAPRGYSFMGALRDVARLESETGPEVGRRLTADGVDAALVTPT